MLKIKGNQFLQFYAENFCLSNPVNYVVFWYSFACMFKELLYIFVIRPNKKNTCV